MIEETGLFYYPCLEQSPDEQLLYQDHSSQILLLEIANLGENRNATNGSFSHFPWGALEQQGRWCQKLKFKTIKRVPPFNQTKFEGMQNFVVE